MFGRKYIISKVNMLLPLVHVKFSDVQAYNGKGKSSSEKAHYMP
jgi:hypothetical protein